MKIGYRIALKLLRCGATVVATTRFPRDAARRFAREADHGAWADRLHVLGADFRDLKALEAMCDALPSLVGRLDIIVNNACQTVRRPPQYYLPLIAAERAAPSDGDQVGRWTDGHRRLLGTAPAAPRPADALVPGMSLSAPPPAAAAAANGDDGGGVAASALLAAAAVAPGDETVDAASFPAGARDANCDLNQQLDLRSVNSWMLRLEGVSTAEMAEVLAINALAPAILNGRLRAFMEASPPLGDDDGAALKFIVNVSAMEGRFYKFKLPTHPHTNMAKAALNMMTRTSAGDYAKAKIYMTAVDTGWINDEKPAALAAADAKTHNFQTPIDEIDAAARCLDPIIAPLLRAAAGEPADPPYGCFLKDYAPCEW